MEFFAFRLNRIRIVNNRDWGRGELKLLSLVVDHGRVLPELTALHRTDDAGEQRALFADAVRSVLGSPVILRVDQVTDGHTLTFGDTGYALYTAAKIPDSFNWALLVFELDADVRRVGEAIAAVVGAPGFDAFAANVLTVAGAAANPAAVAGTAIARFAFGILAETLMRNRDDQIGVVYQSFNRFEHYPHGERKRDGVPDLSNNVRIDYSLFGTLC